MVEKKRLTLTGNKMPVEIYEKLEKLGSDRKLTPYICSLIEKEEQMDTLINSLSQVMHKLNNIENIILGLNYNMTNTGNPIVLEKEKPISTDFIREGKLDISDNIRGGITEEIPDMDF